MKVSLLDLGLESFIKAKVLHLCNSSNSKADAENSQFLLCVAWLLLCLRSKLCQIGKERSQVRFFYNIAVATMNIAPNKTRNGFEIQIANDSTP